MKKLSLLKIANRFYKAWFSGNETRKFAKLEVRKDNRLYRHCFM